MVHPQLASPNALAGKTVLEGCWAQLTLLMQPVTPSASSFAWACTQALVHGQGAPFSPEGQLPRYWAPPAEGQKPGDFIIMRAEMNCVCVMSACPSDDICGINGPDGTQSVHYEVLESQ